MTYLVTPLGVELHTLTEDQVFGLLRAFPDIEERTVGLGFVDDVLEQPAALIFHLDGDVADTAELVDGARAAVEAVDLTPGTTEVLTDDEYETRAYAQATTDGQDG